MWSIAFMPWSSRKRLVAGLPIAFGVAYPALVYIGLDRIPASLFVSIALVAILLRMAALRRAPQFGLLLYPLFGVLAVQVALLVADDGLALRAYPVLMSLAFAAAFGISLRQPPSLVERFARLRTPEISPPARRYMRGLTLVWLMFLLANAAVSAWVALYGSIAAWALYNGLIAYLLVGLLTMGELVVRRIVKRRAATA